ncbi:ATP-binding cassette domain-containing protein [Paracraurococcus ruber]|uniref:ATP-binding cassette domain-containing protein n=1 Tax=Paracraurococcus ruber TaxID=77675 RepID=UPI00105791C5|nr:ATP-binding cassette domain-containing protein [Paracraurococcus ruber]TDG14529.1 ATP-binding cassette domain-containing protein [Paracraurococcus ruber]
MRPARRRWLAPEVVQTSAMDCGPAALACLLQGHGIPASYGRLREACQTDVDGTSIDTIEAVANRLGLLAEQVMLPPDHLPLRSAAALPCLLVLRQADGGTHFVVAWRRLGPWLEVMDPASGRRWVPWRRLRAALHRHSASVPAAAWRGWAGGAEFLAPLTERMAAIGAGGRDGAALRDAALADPDWFGIAALDAAVRLVQALADAGGIAPGGEARRLLHALVAETRAHGSDIFRAIPPGYWSVTPDPDATDPACQHLLLHGAALVRIRGRRETAPADAAPLPQELAAALREAPPAPLRRLWAMVRGDGLARPLALAGAVLAATLVVLVETLLFRALLDMAALLAPGGQRLAALLALGCFAALLLVLQVPVAAETLRLGRHLELRLRMALLRKLPRLPDRYFQSRPISDMAERGHGMHVARLVPGTVVHAWQMATELLLTTAGVILLAPGSAGFALALAATGLLSPLLLQPLLRERDLRVRAHLGALAGFALDALLGLFPIRAHRGEAAVQRQHEALVVEWLRAGRGLARLALGVEAVESLLCLGLAAGLLGTHFARSGTVTGGDLLLVYWVLKLPDLGRGLAAQARQLPAQQNALARLLEPLAALEALDTPPPAPPAGPAALRIEGGRVVAAGHVILRDLDLAIAPGEHVAVVGPSGAGKSSLLGLVLGWHRLAEGNLLLDGAPLDAAAQAALRQRTAWVDPAIQLWNRSLLDNLAYATPDGGLDRLGEAIEAARLRDLLRGLPDGLQARLGEGGGLLSGGEGQRVRLGRAVLQQDLRLVLLDEPFRGLDRPRRAALLAEALRRWRGLTLLCVTHDVGETRLFDRVLVVEEGRIAEDGAPVALAAAPGRYRALLEAEAALLEHAWAGTGWRRLTLADGVLRAPP